MVEDHGPQHVWFLTGSNGSSSWIGTSRLEETGSRNHSVLKRPQTSSCTLPEDFTQHNLMVLTAQFVHDLPSTHRSQHGLHGEHGQLPVALAARRRRRNSSVLQERQRGQHLELYTPRNSNPNADKVWTRTRGCKSQRYE